MYDRSISAMQQLSPVQSPFNSSMDGNASLGDIQGCTKGNLVSIE
jgi:hypothetical protein